MWPGNEWVCNDAAVIAPSVGTDPSETHFFVIEYSIGSKNNQQYPCPP